MEVKTYIVDVGKGTDLTTLVAGLLNTGLFILPDHCAPFYSAGDMILCLLKNPNASGEAVLKQTIQADGDNVPEDFEIFFQEFSEKFNKLLGNPVESQDLEHRYSPPGELLAVHCQNDDDVKSRHSCTPTLHRHFNDLQPSFNMNLVMSRGDGLVFEHPGGQQTILCEQRGPNTKENPNNLEMWFERRWNPSWQTNRVEVQRMDTERWTQNTLNGYVDVICELQTPISINHLGKEKFFYQVTFRRRFWELPSEKKLCPLAFGIFSGAAISDELYEGISNEEKKKLSVVNRLGAAVHYLLFPKTRSSLANKRRYKLPEVSSSELYKKTQCLFGANKQVTSEQAQMLTNLVDSLWRNRGPFL